MHAHHLPLLADVGPWFLGAGNEMCKMMNGKKVLLHANHGEPSQVAGIPCRLLRLVRGSSRIVYSGQSMQA